MSSEREKGLKLFEEIYGPEMAAGTARHAESSTDFGSKQSAWTLDWAFGSVWARDTMERKMRSCTVLGMLIAQGQFDEIRFHTRMGIANGLTRTELEEIFYSAIPYCGFPAANTAKRAMLEAFAELDSAEDG